MLTLTTDQIDLLIEEHFRYECEDDVEGVLSTLSEDAIHDVVGSPLGELARSERGPRLLRAALRGHRRPQHHEYPSLLRRGLRVDESLWEGVRGTSLGIRATAS